MSGKEWPDVPALLAEARERAERYGDVASGPILRRLADALEIMHDLYLQESATVSVLTGQLDDALHKEKIVSEETTKKIDWLGGLVKARKRKEKSDAELVRAIVDAWNSPGERPKYHKQMQGMLRHSWPSLAEPVRELAGRAKKRATLNEGDK